jgi:hypothetical protein
MKRIQLFCLTETEKSIQLDYDTRKALLPCIQISDAGQSTTINQPLKLWLYASCHCVINPITQLSRQKKFEKTGVSVFPAIYAIKILINNVLLIWQIIKDPHYNMNENAPSKKTCLKNTRKTYLNSGEKAQKNKLRPLYPSCRVFHLPHAFIE